MDNPTMTLYEYSKQVISKEVPMDPIIFNQKMLEVAHSMFGYCYNMLLCNERRDFTLFHNTGTDEKKLATELAECLCNRGNVLLVDLQPDGAWEIWIRDPQIDENFAYYFFNYEDGVIEVK